MVSCPVRVLWWWSLLSGSAAAATFTVTSSADTAGATCAASCTLRQALSAAGTAAGTDTIAFNIPGAGPHRISVTTALPSAANTVIDGLSQPGALANSDPRGSNAVLKIILDGRTLTQTMLGGANLSVRGLSVLGPAAHVAVQALGGTVAGNWFGVEPDGTTTVAHGISVELNSSASHVIGGAAVADRNVLVAATVGIGFQSAALGNNTVQNNLIGLLPDGSTPAAVGIAVNAIGALPAQTLTGNTISCTGTLAVRNFGSAVQSNRFGTTADGLGNPGCTTGAVQTVGNRSFSGNTFGHYALPAVSLANTVSGVVFLGNRVVGGTAVPFDLNGNGFTFNDTGDGDTGANSLQNHPEITESRRLDEDQVLLAGTLHSQPNTRYALEFFAAPEITRVAASSFPLANAERVATGLIEVLTDANGLASFGPQAVEFDGSGELGAVVGTATRLDGSGIAIETSEYGLARAVYTQASGDFVVTTTASSGPGSLFRALLEAEARPDGAGRDRVVFDVPGTGPFALGLGPLTTPIFDGRLEIDGSTQPGTVANSASSGSNAQLQIAFDNLKLSLRHDDVLLRGLVLRGPSALLSLAGGAVEGSFVGVSIDGLALSSSAQNTTQINCAGPCRIGGPLPAQRNIVGCPASNGLSCLNIQPLGNSGVATIQNNLIGVNATGLAALVTPGDPGSGSQVLTGIAISRQFTVVRGNVIGGLVNGIRAIGVGNITIADNRIGGSAALGNARHGVVIDNATATFSSNLISHNGRDGVLIGAGSALNGLIDNTLHDNGELGLELNISGSASVFGDGVSPNDPGDVDTLANGGQNFPVLSEVRRDGDGVRADIVLDSLPSRQYRLRYCYLGVGDSSGHGECEQPLAGVVQTISTDANGQFSGSTPLLPATVLQRLTVTAARVQGAFEETSEFSAAVFIADQTTTSIVSTAPDPAVFGQPLNVSVSVAGISATPVGTVQISGSTGGSCTATLSAGSGSCTLLPGAAGPLVLTASYAGSTSFTASTATAALEVQRAPTVTLISADTPDPSTFGDAITVSFSVQGDAVPTGSVVVIDGVGSQCSGVLDGAGRGACVLVPGAGGSLTLSASYAQTANFAASADTEAHQVNAVASTLAILADTPDPSVFGQAVLVEVQLGSSVGIPAGPILVSDGAGASCQVNGANGSCQLIPGNVGNLSLRADFAGDTTHLQSTATTAHVVGQASTLLSPGIVLGADGFAPRQFAPLRFPLSVSAIAPGAGSPGGAVTVTGIPGVEVCVLNLPAASCDLVAQSPGLRTFQLQYAGDLRFAPSSAEVSVQVLPDALFTFGFEGDDPE